MGIQIVSESWRTTGECRRGSLPSLTSENSLPRVTGERGSRIWAVSVWTLLEHVQYTAISILTAQQLRILEIGSVTENISLLPSRSEFLELETNGKGHHEFTRCLSTIYGKITSTVPFFYFNIFSKKIAKTQSKTQVLIIKKPLRTTLSKCQKKKKKGRAEERK